MSQTSNDPLSGDAPLPDSEPLRRDCLIAVVTNDADLKRFSEQRWYRIPERAIGRSLKVDSFGQFSKLALYQTSLVSNGLPSSIELWGEIDEVLRMPRRKIIPEEPNHPAADEIYRLIRVKSAERLDHPITSRRPRRITFVRTTGERLFRASDVNDLIVGSPAEERLWNALKDLDAERKYYMRAGGSVMEVDFAIFSNDRTLGVVCGGDDGYDSSGMTDAWSILRFSPGELESEFTACLQEIMAAMQEMRRESPLP